MLIQFEGNSLICFVSKALTHSYFCFDSCAAAFKMPSWSTKQLWYTQENENRPNPFSATRSCIITSKHAMSKWLMCVSWGFATQVLWGSFLCWFKVLPVWFTLVYTNLHTLLCALCFLCFLFSVFCVLHSWVVWSAVDLMLIVDFWLLLTLTFGNLHNVYDTVSDVVESKVHQCQQNSDA